MVFLHIYSLTKNLLSVSVMTDLRCIVEFDDHQVLIQKRCVEPLAKGVQEGGLYKVEGNLVIALVHHSDNLSLGHLHYAALSILNDTSIIKFQG